MNYRSVFLSDIHLGNRWCHTDQLTSFLSDLSCDRLYLLGDVFEGWNRKNSARWNLRRHPLMRRVIKMSRASRIQYITGNHDAFLDEFSGLSFDGVEILKESFHQTLDGRKLLLVHGDEFDIINQYRKHLAKIGHSAYQAAMNINSGLESLFSFRKKTGKQLFVANFFKDRVKDFVQKISDFDNSIRKTVKDMETDGIICGHIHRPEIRLIGDASYYNCGDWLNSCSALVEHFDGSFEVLRWNHGPETLFTS